jgi:serine protease inhibitor
LTALALLFFLNAPQLSPQDSQQAEPASFLRSNDRFGAVLLNMIQEQSPDNNIAIAPLPVSLTFAALLDGSTDSKSRNEIVSTFQWERGSSPDIAARMLHARFEKPKQLPIQSSSLSKKSDPSLKTIASTKPEGMWLSAAFLYRGKGSLSQEFIDRVRYFFGFDFRAVRENESQSDILAKNWDSALPMPAINGSNDFWITSFVHLRTAWAGNTFAEARREKHDFRLRSGKTVQADFLTSETASYHYAHTEDFQAVALICWQSSILLVLPEREQDIGQLAASMVKNPGWIEPSLKVRQGDVQMPPFHISYEGNFRDALEKMGVHQIFYDTQTLLSMAPKREGGKLQGVAQKAEIEVDESGIRADAGTNVGGVFGGKEMIQPGPFHMVLNRPFLFVIRDTATSALLFTGIVQNPTLH